MVTRRHLSENPPPHATEQSDHFGHYLSLQFLSQAPVLHGLESWAVLQDIPPSFSIAMILAALPLSRKLGALHAELVGLDNDHAGERLPTAATEQFFCLGTRHRKVQSNRLARKGR